MITQLELSENAQLDDLLMILAIKVNIVNVADQDQFAYFTQLDINESETYTHIMQSPNIVK